MSIPGSADTCTEVITPRERSPGCPVLTRRSCAVEVAREQAKPIAHAADIGISELSAELARSPTSTKGHKEGLTTAEHEELVRLRRENRVPRMDFWRIFGRLRKRHVGLNMHTLVRRFLPRWDISDGGIEMFRPRAVAIERYRYRGTRIPTPWSSASTTGSPASAA